MPKQPVPAGKRALPNAGAFAALSSHSRVSRDACEPVSPWLPPVSLCRSAGWQDVLHWAWLCRALSYAVLAPLPLEPLQALQLACPHFPFQHSPARAAGRQVLCCAQAPPSLQGPWLPAALALPRVRSIPSEGWWPEQEGLCETPVTLDLVTLQGILLLAWLTCVGLSLLHCPPAAGPQSVLLLP